MNGTVHSEVVAARWQEMVRRAPFIADLPVREQVLLRTFFYSGVQDGLRIAAAVDEMEDEERGDAFDAMLNEIEAELALNRTMAMAAISARGGR